MAKRGLTGWPSGLPVCVVIVLVLVSSLASAGPVYKSDTSDLSTSQRLTNNDGFLLLPPLPETFKELATFQSAPIIEDSLPAISPSSSSLVHDSDGALGSTDDVSGVSTDLVQRDAGAAEHNYALVCGEDRLWTSFCQKAAFGYYCNSNGALRNTKQEERNCEALCECVDLSPPPRCIITLLLTTCNVDETETSSDGDQTSGSSLDSDTSNNGNLTLSSRHKEPDLGPGLEIIRPVATASRDEPRRTFFDVVCLSDEAVNQTLTALCRARQYFCLHPASDWVATLEHDGPEEAECSQNCLCSAPFTSGALSQRSVSSEGLDALGDTTDVTETAPLSGVPSQTTDVFRLSCANRVEGPIFCMDNSRGFFCQPNGTVARTSTQSDPGITYCDFYCHCIFRHPIPCINEWDIPMCQEVIDGTVRDASRLDLVLGGVDASYLLDNGSLLLDRGTPFFIGPNSTGFVSAEDI